MCFQYSFRLARSLATKAGGFFYNCPAFTLEESWIFLSECCLADLDPEGRVDDLFFLRFRFLLSSFSRGETSFLSWWEAVCRPEELFFNGVDSAFLAGNLVTRVKYFLFHIILYKRHFSSLWRIQMISIRSFGIKLEAIHSVSSIF